MRLTSLTMQDFRCFRGSTKIDLDANVVAIYGRNGSGKTTVFDAIEFAFFGEIGRFAAEHEKLVSYLPNALETALPKVRVDYIDAAPNHIGASLQSDDSIVVTPNWSNRRQFLYDCLVQDNYQSARREVSAISDLFRASVLLSQRSIRHFVEADPSVRVSFLAHISGVPYLQRCLEKAQDVQKLADKREAEAGSASEVMAAELQKIANDLAATENRRKAILARLGDKLISRDDLMKAMAAARLTLVAVAQTENPEEIAAGAKALCRETLADIDRRDRALAELEAAARGHLERVGQRQVLSKERDGLQASAAQLEKHEVELSGAIASTQAKVRLTQKTLEDLKARLLAFDQLSQVRTQLVHQQEQLQNAEKHQQELQGWIREARTRLDGLSATLSKTDSDRLNLMRLRDSAISSLDMLRKLQESLPAYRSDIESFRRCDTQLAEVEQERKALEAQRVHLQQTQNALSRKLATAQQKHSALNSAQQRKNSLVAGLREYATGDQCPMCGTKHQTPEALANAIERQLQTAPREVRDLARQVETDRAELQRAESELRVANENFARCDERRRAISADRAALVSRTTAQDRLAEQARTRMETEAINQAISTLEVRLREAAKNLEEAEAETRRLGQERNQVEMAVSQYEPGLTQENQKLAAGQAAINRLQRRAAELGHKDAMNWSADELVKHRADAENEQEANQAQKSKAENELTSVTQEWKSTREAREKVGRDLEQSITKLARVTEAVNRAERLCQQLGVGTHNPEDAVKTLRENLADLRKRVNFAAATTEQYHWSSAVAALTDEEQRTRPKHQELVTNIEAVDNERHRLNNAGRVAARWSDKLRDEVARVVERRIRLHQPEILRLFKAMVPCPYIFEDVRMERSKNGVNLGLKYREQVRPPAEPKLFLSEAQANVLALALFLSFACSQKWSRLQTILLDDPVQHLDDLDAVAFLDNLRTVALHRKKQVIVSTCDQNLYLLMIRKFRVIGKEGIRFRGISLLENGSNAPEVIYDIGGPGLNAAVA